MDRPIGICLGASTITLARWDQAGLRLHSRPHDGEVGRALASLVETCHPARLGITGRKYRHRLAVPTVSEPEAVELAYAHLKSRYPATDCIVSLGGETFLAYYLDAQGKIRDVQTGNKCAAGTGEFFLQQTRRLGLTVDEALGLAEGAAPYPVAGRCSVFCKSDCTHALNKGIPKSRVVAGLCRMMAGKILELLKAGQPGRVALIGGVSRNRVLLKLLEKECPGIFVPEEAVGFEALGALLWAENHGVAYASCLPLPVSEKQSFEVLPALAEGLAKVTFHPLGEGDWGAGDYLCGLDVGSTTTKAVLVEVGRKALVASVYLRTNGDPVGASRQCYQRLSDQFPRGFRPRIVGLGVTGSGRQIAGLHALTDGIVNEIIAHAAAAVHFDPEVETIFEIGGQDAKYTWIVNRVAGDYAMNEACSAGTGSFLEEACRETVGIATEEIAGLALKASNPPNFSDQCAAFIGSDIKTAAQEGLGTEEIAAGLVYAICQNYLNRVKGNRPVGGKIFMQGGVCYNRAVPAAMAVLCGQPIVVPPEPGLMGAFGAALEVLRKQEQGLLQRTEFDLAALAAREVSARTPFVCPGGPEGCDRRCSIARVVIEGRTYPFGGACSLYDRRQAGDGKSRGRDLVRLREELVFHRYAPEGPATAGPSVGLLPALFGTTFYPLYAHFFTALGLRVVRPETPDPAGMEAAGAAFCQPLLLSHGYLRQLLSTGIDYVFLPHVKSVALDAPTGEANCTCPLIQGETYCLSAAFPQEVGPRLLTAVLEFHDTTRLREAFVAIGRRLGKPQRLSRQAFDRAWRVQQAMFCEMRNLGREFLAALDPESPAIILFGRPYNAFSSAGNMGIPHKFSGRGLAIIPHDFLPLDETDRGPEYMFWTIGRQILRAAGQVSRHPALFGAFVTNFSCGPDSFLLGYFREIMGQKPALTLEIDAHTADAGVDTRIEAFLDVVANFRETRAGNPPRAGGQAGEERRPPAVRAVRPSIFDRGARILVPSMGDNGSRGLAAAFRHVGIDAVAAPPPGRRELELGKAVATCKECLPLLLTVGSLRRYLELGERPEGHLFYFMATSDGPCRLGQYRVFLEKYLARQGYADVSLLTLSCEDGYAGLPARFTRRAWQALCIADGLDEIEATIRAVAVAPAAALTRLEVGRQRLFRSLEEGASRQLLTTLEEEMLAMAAFPRRIDPREALRVNLVGEIYVRRDDFSRQNLVERLAERGVVVYTAPVTEWLSYSDYCTIRGLSSNVSLGTRIATGLKQVVKLSDQRAIRRRMAASGFLRDHLAEIPDLVRASSRLINPALATEASLTVGSTLLELGGAVHGVISIGPFGCLPCRIAEAVLRGTLQQDRGEGAGARQAEPPPLPLPFLAIETDGNPFPQLVEARLESFMMSAQRLREGLASRAP